MHHLRCISDYITCLLSSTCHFLLRRRFLCKLLILCKLDREVDELGQRGGGGYRQRNRSGPYQAGKLSRPLHLRLCSPGGLSSATDFKESLRGSRRIRTRSATKQSQSEECSFHPSRIGDAGGRPSRNIDRGGPVPCSDQRRFDYTGSGLRSLKLRWCQ